MCLGIPSLDQKYDSRRNSNKDNHTQFETFHAPKEDSVPDEYRAVGGALVDKPTGMAFGSHWQDLIKQAPKLNEVDSTNARKAISNFERKYRSKK